MRRIWTSDFRKLSSSVFEVYKDFFLEDKWSVSNLTGLCTARLPKGRLFAMFWLDRRVSRGRFAAAFDGFGLFVVSEIPLDALADRSCMRCTAARDKYWQKTRKTIVSKAHATWWVRRKVVVEREGVLCCIVVLVRKKENVREPEAKSRFMVVARSLVHCLLVRFGNSPRMECNQMNLCRVCAAEQA